MGNRKMRRFSGLVDWYTLIFDEDFSVIIAGEVQHHFPGVSDRDSKEQVLYYRAATLSDSGAAANVLRYTRWYSEDSSPSSTFQQCEPGHERPPSAENSDDPRSSDAKSE